MDKQSENCTHYSGGRCTLPGFDRAGCEVLGGTDCGHYDGPLSMRFHAIWIGLVSVAIVAAVLVFKPSARFWIAASAVVALYVILYMLVDRELALRRERRERKLRSKRSATPVATSATPVHDAYVASMAKEICIICNRPYPEHEDFGVCPGQEGKNKLTIFHGRVLQ